MARFPAAEREHQLGREFKTGQTECGINPAFKTVPRIAIDPEFTAGLSNIQRVPERRFNQHLRRMLVTARHLATHDTGDRLNAVIISDHHNIGIRPIGFAVERDNFIAVTRAADNKVALDFLGIENVKRAATVKGQIIRDIDKGVDRT